MMKSSYFRSMAILLLLCLCITTGWSQGTSGKHVSISTRYAGEYLDDSTTQGPAPGDIAMQILLQDNGISARVVPDKTFYDLAADTYVLTTTGEDRNIDMAILSGSSGSGDVPDVAPLFAKGIPIMMGEHVCLAEEVKPGSIKMYMGTSEAHKDLLSNDLRKVKLVNKDHPITKGIKTDAEGWVQIFRDPFPNEGFFKAWEATTPKDNVALEGLYQNRVALGLKTAAAEGTVILAEIPAELAPAEDMVSCFAVLDKGAKLADGTVSKSRLVHWMTNEEGSGGPHRNFLALNAVGRTLFVRACQWAMGMEPTAQVADFSLYENE